MKVGAIPSPQEQVIPETENLLKALLLIALVAASFYAADRIAGVLETPFKWLLVALLGIVDVVLLTGMGVLAHDGVHRVLFRAPFWNELLGGLLSALTFIPFHANRQFHLTHHSYAHQPGLDPEEAMHRHSFPFAFAAGSTIGLYEQYRLLFDNVRNLRDGRRAWRAAQDAAFFAVAAAVYFLMLPALGISLLATVLPLVLAFPLVFAFRAMSDHYGLPPVAREANEQVTAWVVLTPRWLEWLWSHINYHDVHHRYPYLSHIYLPQVFAATRDRHPYLVVRGYWRSLLNLRKRSYYSTVNPAAGLRIPR